MDVTQKAFRNTVSLIFANVIAQLLGWGVTVFLARKLGPGFFGQFSFVYAVFIYFSLFANFGLSLFGTRQIARDPNHIEHYLANIIALRLVLALCCYGCLTVFASCQKNALQDPVMLMIYGLGLFPLAFQPDWILQGLEKLHWVGLGKIVSWGSYTTFIILFIGGPEHLERIPLAYVFSLALSMLVSWGVFIRSCGLPRIKLSLGAFSAILRSTLPFGASLLLVQIVQNLDAVMIGLMRNTDEVGQYNAAYNVIMFLIMLGGAYFDSIYPLISKYYSQQAMGSLAKVQYYSMWLVAVVVLPMSVGGTVLADPIIRFLYGPEYQSAVLPFQILIWSILLWALNNVYVRGLLGCSRERGFIGVLSLQALLNVVMVMIAIPRYGLVGAAASTVIAELVGLLLYAREFRKVLELSPCRAMIKPLIASGVMAAFLFGIGRTASIHVMLQVMVGIAVYVVFLWIIRGIANEQIALLKQVVHRR
jgi:O-antigen/teichoic acid export membrane protein